MEGLTLLPPSINTHLDCLNAFSLIRMDLLTNLNRYVLNEPSVTAAVEWSP